MDSYQVRCRECGTTNRVPAEKQGISGNCGNCRSKLPALYWQPQELTEKSFDGFITRYDGPVLAEFWAPW